MPTRFEVRAFAAEHVGEAALLLADRHRRQRQAVPALNPVYEDATRCAELVESELSRDGALGAVALRDGTVAGFVLCHPRSVEQWGPNAWAEDAGNAGEGEAIRAAYAIVAAELVERDIRGHWAMTSTSDAALNEAWFSLSFGLQQCYAWQPPKGPDFQPQTPHNDLIIRRPESADVPALAQLDLVLPRHVGMSPVFSKVKVPDLDETEAELAEDIKNPKYSFWVAEHGGRVIATMVGVNVEESSAWTAMMKPASAAMLGYAATFAEARGLGAGRALTDAFFAWARDEGYEWLVTDWRSTNLEANRTWRAMGFVPMWNRLYRSIP